MPRDSVKHPELDCPISKSLQTHALNCKVDFWYDSPTHN